MVRRQLITSLVVLGICASSWAQEEGENQEDDPVVQLPDEVQTEDLPLQPGPAEAIDQATGGSTPDVERSSHAELGSISARKRIFGSYRLRLSVMRPKFDDGLNFYEELYGRERVYPAIQADWFAWDWYATIGLSFRAGFYQAEGHTAKQVAGKSIDQITDDDIEANPDAPTSLTLIPFQYLITAEFTPFSGKWLVLDAYAGFERMYWQEVRATEDAGTAALIQTTEDDDTLTNKGWNNATVIGGSANVLLNSLDEKAVNSMRGTMGLGAIYLSPFIEIVRTNDDDGVSFGRTSMGLGFTFESVK